MAEVVGRMNYEQKEWANRNSPQYVKNIVFNERAINIEFPIRKAQSPGVPINSYQPLSLSGTNYLQNLSFFCRQEYNFEKHTNIPLRFRIGSLDYTNYLEHKLNTGKPGF